MTTSPIITVVSPSLPDQNSDIEISLNNPLDQVIEFRIERGDLDTSLDLLSALNVIIDGYFAVINGSVQSGYDLSSTQDGYNYLISVSQDAHFDYLQSVNVVVALALVGYPTPTKAFSFITLDNLPPQITNTNPALASTQAAPTQAIQFDLRKGPFELPIDLNTLTVKLIGLSVDPDTGEPLETIVVEPDSSNKISYDQRIVSIIPNNDRLGYSVKIQPLLGLPPSARIVVQVSVSKLNSSYELNYEWFFSTIDDAAPTITWGVGQGPLPNSTNNSIGTHISFSITDRGNSFFGTGIDRETLQVIIDDEITSTTAIQNGQILTTNGYNGNISPNLPQNGYDIFLVRNDLFLPRKIISVKVTVGDNSGNIQRTTYSFGTESVTPPSIVFVYPQQNATNLPQDVEMIIDIVSAISVAELDIESITVTINGIIAFSNNTFQGDFAGKLFGTSSKNLSLLLQPQFLFPLSSSVTIEVAVSNAFGNQNQATTSFTITPTITLTSTATPAGGIYDLTDSNTYFPPAGSWITVSLTSNISGAIIGYTLDGYEPSFGTNGNPQGTTTIYSAPIQLLTFQQAMLAHKAYDPSSSISSKSTMEIYAFTQCAEVDSFKDVNLQKGLEYSRLPKFTNVNFRENALQTGSTSFRGIARYIHDLGRISYIDSLNFISSGSASFKVRVADSITELAQASWLNSNIHLSDGLAGNLITYSNGLETNIEVINNKTKVSGRKGTTGFFNDEARATLNSILPTSFLIQGDIVSNINKDTIVGFNAFFRLFDESNTLEIQQYLSKAKAIVGANDNLSSLVGESPIVKVNNLIINNDGYNTLTDGYEGYVVLIPPPKTIDQTIDFTFIKQQSIPTYIDLEEDTTGVFSVKSQSLAVYNAFKYSQQAEGYAYPSISYESSELTELDHIQPIKYSSAKVKEVFYSRLSTTNDTIFAIPVANVPLDIALAEVTSENLELGSSEYKFAETNNVFSTSLFLESGDYNFRYQVTSSAGTRIVGNPFIFQTLQDLSVELSDGYNYTLITNTGSYPIESIVKLQTGEYAFEFKSIFPLSTYDILTWELRSPQNSVLSSAKITVDNLLSATITTDASGALGNIILNSRSLAIFKYISSTATKVTLLGTFNNFNTDTNILEEGFDPSAINLLFDKKLDTVYHNNTISTHKVTIKLLLPMIVDRVRFYTGAAENQKQRTRLSLDGAPTTTSTYRAYRNDSQIAKYAPSNAVDVYTYQDNIQDWTEWRYVQIGSKLNSTFRKTIELTTRFDAFENTIRQHKQLDIYTRIGIPQVVSDFTIPNNKFRLTRTNKTDFAAESNIVTVKYARLRELYYAPTALLRICDRGIVDNFLRADIITLGQVSTDGYFNAVELFHANDKVVVSSSAGDLTYTTIVGEPNSTTGLITFADPIPTNGFVVKDYTIEEEENNFIINLEVPKFITAFYGIIHDFGSSIQLTPETPRYIAGDGYLGGSTILAFENTLKISGETLLGGRLTYPLLEKPSKIMSASSVETVLNGTLISFIIVSIDQLLEHTHDELGATIEIYNTTTSVTDYVISKTDGTAKFLNNSLVSSGAAVEIKYDHIPIVFQAPAQTKTFEVNTNDQIELKVEASLVNVTIAELESFSIDFFNGYLDIATNVLARAPASVTFEINNEGSGFLYAKTISLPQAIIVDGYSDHLFDPIYPNTGQIVQFKLPITEIPLGQVIDGYGYVDGYGTVPFNSLIVKFTGQSRYEIGEVQATVKNSITDSACRVTLNGIELYKSSKPINKLSRIEVGYDQDMIFVTYDRETVLHRPLILQNAHFSFGATGKVLDDPLEVDFSNVSIFEYFTSSPAKVHQIGRFVEIEGVLIS